MDTERTHRRAISTVFGTLALAASLLAGLYIEQSVRIRGAEQDIIRRLALEQNTVESTVNQVESDVRMLSAIPGVARVVAPDATEADFQSAERILYAFASSKADYAQVRVLDARGIERVRVDNRDGQSIVIPREELQDKSGRYYVEEGFGLALGSIYSSPLDLNVEQGVVETPRKPMLRLVTPVLNQATGDTGLIVVNLFGNAILRDLARASGEDPGQFMIADSAGNWLYAGDPSIEWAMMYPDQVIPVAPETFPDVWTDVVAMDGVAKHTASELFAASWVIPFSVQGQANGTGSWHLIYRASLQALNLDFVGLLRSRLAGYLLALIIWGSVIDRLAVTRLDRKRYRDRLEEVAFSDELTGLANRRYLFEFLEHQCLVGDRYSHPFGVLFIDLDGFKSVNDRYGHEAGDRVLKEVSQRMKEGRRETDFVARHGGDEFVMVLPETGRHEQLERVAEKILTDIGRPIEVADGVSVQVGASIGLFGTADPGCIEFDTSRSDEILRVTDSAMYRAKTAGKNRFAWASIGD